MAPEIGQQSPFKRRGFIIAAIVVALLVVVAVVVIATAITKSGGSEVSEGQTPQPTETAPPTDPGGSSDEKSVCGLKAVKMEGHLDAPPEAEWRYVGTVTYPGSTTHGPADTTDDGYSMCFDRTPAGAVFAATAGMAQLTAAETTLAAMTNGVMPGELRDEGIAALTAEPPTDDDLFRHTYSGFKLLSYDGEEAVVDLGMTAVGKGKSVYLSVLVPLIWHDGDWKMNFNETNMKEPAQLPNLAGYVLWKE